MAATKNQTNIIITLKSSNWLWIFSLFFCFIYFFFIIRVFIYKRVGKHPSPKEIVVAVVELLIEIIIKMGYGGRIVGVISILNNAINN